MANSILEQLQTGEVMYPFYEGIGKHFWDSYNATVKRSHERPSYKQWSNTVEGKIADISRKRQEEKDRIEEQNKEQVRQAAKIERKQLEEKVKAELNNINQIGGANVDQDIEAANKFKAKIDEYKRVEKSGNLTDYNNARNTSALSGTPLIGKDIPHYPAGYTEYSLNGDIKTYDGNGNYLQGVKDKDGIMSFSQKTPMGQAPIWAPQDAQRVKYIPQASQPTTQGAEQPVQGTGEKPPTLFGNQIVDTKEEKRQPPANVYETKGGYQKDSTPIPDILQGGKILPFQYYQQNGIPMEGRADLAVKLGIIQDPSQWAGEAGQNYRLIDALEKQKQGGAPTTDADKSTTEKPGEWIADKARPVYHVEGQLKTTSPYESSVPSRFKDPAIRQMLEGLPEAERTKKIQELDLGKVQEDLRSAINNSDVSMINQILGTTYHQGNERERMEELPMILNDARTRLSMLTPDEASRYMDRQNTAYTKAGPNAPPNFDPGRQQVLMDIARGSTKYQTEITPDEQKLIERVQADDRKTKIRENFNKFTTDYSNLLQQGDIEGAKALKANYQTTVNQLKQLSPEFASYAPEMERMINEQVKVVKGPEIKPKKETPPRKNIQTKPHPQPAPLGFSQKDLNEQQLTNLREMQSQGKSLDEMRNQAIQYNDMNIKARKANKPIEGKAPPEKNMKVGSFAQQNSGNIPTLTDRIETSNITPDSPQALGLEKNPLRRN